MYEQSQLQFYFVQIAKLKPDTQVTRVYGQAGTVIHSCAEKFIFDRNELVQYIENTNYNKDKYLRFFNDKWRKYRLNEEVGFNQKPLDKETYIKSLFNTLDYITDKPDINKHEHKFLFPIINTQDAEVNIKGFIDAMDPKNHIIYDWKTNSSISNFTNHAKMYCYAYYREFGHIPKAIYYYTKLNKSQAYQFTKEELDDFEIYIFKIINEIVSKGFDVSKYDAGDWSHTFNEFFGYCQKEVHRRENTKTINVYIKKNFLFFDGTLSVDLKKFFIKKYNYKVAGCEFSPKFQAKQWDGHKYFFRNNTLPIGFIHDLKQLIKDYNTHFKKEYILNFIDYRDKEVLNKKYDTHFKDSEYELYDFQKECVNIAIDKEIGILYIGTGGGKTIIASEIIKQLNTKTLFIVNRIELAEQTKDVLEDYLGVKVGLMTEGNIDVDKQITVASVQTIACILKRNNDDSLKTKDFLYNIGLTIYDETQNIRDIGYYGLIRRNIINSKYIIGLSGTPFRSI